MPAQANATITRVTGAGVADDWDRAAVAGAAKWAGQARAYYRATTTRTTGAGGATNIITKRELIVDVPWLDLSGVDEDDVITFRRDGATADETGKASSIPRAELNGVPVSLVTSRIRLEDV